VLSASLFSFRLHHWSPPDFDSAIGDDYQPEQFLLNRLIADRSESDNVQVAGFAQQPPKKRKTAEGTDILRSKANFDPNEKIKGSYLDSGPAKLHFRHTLKDWDS